MSLCQRGNVEAMDDNAFDPYAVLGVPVTASREQITRAYRRKLRALHPDTRDAAPTDPAADEQLRRIMAAYAALRTRPTDRTPRSGPVRIPVRHGRPR
jgi:curved DNA-binding protein CbpA